MSECHLVKNRVVLQISRAVLLGLFLFATVAQAQTATESPSGVARTSDETSTGGLTEIIVTAQRREQTVQNVAISMEAYSGQQLAALGMNNVQDIAQSTPNVQFASFYGNGRPDVAIRGISVGDLFTDFEQSPVGFYNDDVYIGARDGQLGQMFDLDRVEVLRGPQGTLFGRNTTAGAVNFIAKKPGNAFEADGSVTYGRFNEIDVDGGVTAPISDTLSLRVSGIKRQRDGWVFNINPDAPQSRVNDIDNWGARAILRWQPTEGMTWLLNVHGNGNHSATPVIFGDLGTEGFPAPNIYSGYQNPGNWNQTAANEPQYEHINGHGVSATGTIRIGEATLTSISAFDYVDYAEHEDDDGSPIQIGAQYSRSQTRQYSQEFRLAAQQEPFDWVTGLYYYTDKLVQTYYQAGFTDPIFYGSGYSILAVNYPAQSSHNYAGFGDLRYSLTDQWTVDVGARYTHETKHLFSQAFRSFPPDTTEFQTIGGPGNPDSHLNNSWSAPTGKVALEWKPSKGILAYGSYSRGFKSGGYNGLAFNSITELAPYEPETDNTFELGLKTSWLDGRVTANAAVFLNKLNELQVLDVQVIQGFSYFFVRNAGKATTKGGEFQVNAAPGGGWNFSAGLGLLNTRYDRYVLPDGVDYTGEELTNAPKISGNVMVQYSLPLLGGTLGPNVDWSYEGFRWTDNPHRPGIDAIPGYGLLNARIPWTTADERFEFSIWGRNLTNKHYFLETIGNGIAAYGNADSYHADPRTFGIMVRVKFH